MRDGPYGGYQHSQGGPWGVSLWRQDSGWATLAHKSCHHSRWGETVQGVRGPGPDSGPPLCLGRLAQSSRLMVQKRPVKPSRGRGRRSG